MDCGGGVTVNESGYDSGEGLFWGMLGIEHLGTTDADMIAYSGESSGERAIAKDWV